MFRCSSCNKKLSSRIELIVHNSKCKLKRNRNQAHFQLDKEDSDDDPDWIPSGDDLSVQEEQENSRPSSPVTQEQINVAQEVIKLLPDLRNEPVGVSAEPASDETFEAIVPDQTKPLPNQSTNKTLKRLQDIRKSIDTWKTELKRARRDHQTNRARRMTKKIKQWKDEMATISQENSVTCDDIEDESHFIFHEDLEVHSTEGQHNYMTHNMESPKSDISTENNPRRTSVKRKKNFCIYCKRLVSRLAEHIEKSHPDTEEAVKLKSISGNAKDKRLKKMKITEPLRKQWNSEYNKDKPLDQVILVKAKHKVSVKKKEEKGKEEKNKKPVGVVICKYCKGYYRRDKLSIHLKQCDSFEKSKGEEGDESEVIPAIKDHSLAHIHKNILSSVSDAFVNEILKGINLDKVANEAVQDPLIMKFGSEFHQSRRENASRSYVIREIRDLSRLFIDMKEKNGNITCFEDCFNPKYFDEMVESALTMAGYDPKTGSSGVPSVAYRLSQPIKITAEIIKNTRLSNLYKVGSSDRSSIDMINDFLDLINSQWKTKIGRICRKSQKFARVNREEKVALEEDIVKFASYIESRYRKVIADLNSAEDKKNDYNLLMHLLVAHIMLLVRRRPVDFKSANMVHYSNIDKHDDLISMANLKELDDSELNVCKKFHIFYVPGKNLEIVPMVLTPLMKKVMDTLIEKRSDVGITNDTLFSLADNKHIKPNESIKAMAAKVNLKRPKHMTGNGLRHQAATFSRLHSKHPQYQDYLASVLGHNLFTHKKHYDLPTSILQKMMVCPILYNIMTGKNSTGNPSKESTSHHSPTEYIQNASVEPPEEIGKNIYESPQEMVGKEPETPEDMVFSETENDSDEYVYKDIKEGIKPKKRWTEAEQKVVFKHFGHNILRKEIPKRGEVVKFHKKFSDVLKDRSVDQIQLFVRNHVQRKQKNVTPKVKRMLKFDRA